MDEEVYIMHCWFAETYEEVITCIEDYGYGRDNAIIGDKGLEPIEHRGFKITWWYLPGSQQGIINKQRIYSDIQVRYYVDDYHSPTEVKITCSDNLYLKNYLTGLADYLWEHLNIFDEKLRLPHPDSEPIYKSRFDYRIDKASRAGTEEQVFADTVEEVVDPLQVILNSTKMKEYYSSYSSITARKIYDGIPKAYFDHISEGGQWGPGFISKIISYDVATTSRYLGAFHKAGITSITYNGEKIPIPHRSRIQS